MDKEMSTRLYGKYVSDFIDMSNEFKISADPTTFKKRIEEIITSEEFSNTQKAIVIKLEYRSILKTIKQTAKRFEKLSKILNKDAVNIKYADGKNLATLTAKFISETDNTILLDKYYKLFHQFMKSGVDPMHKDNNKLSSLDYIYWAQPSYNKTTTFTQLKLQSEKTK